MLLNTEFYLSYYYSLGLPRFSFNCKFLKSASIFIDTLNAFVHPSDLSTNRGYLVFNDFQTFDFITVHSKAENQPNRVKALPVHSGR